MVTLTIMAKARSLKFSLQVVEIVMDFGVGEELQAKYIGLRRGIPPFSHGSKEHSILLPTNQS